MDRFENRGGGEPEHIGTYHDWDRSRVDLLDEVELSSFFSIPLDIVQASIHLDRTFPRGRVCDDGVRRWRLPDVLEWYEGQRNK